MNIPDKCPECGYDLRAEISVIETHNVISVEHCDEGDVLVLGETANNVEYGEAMRVWCTRCWWILRNNPGDIDWDFKQ